MASARAARVACGADELAVDMTYYCSECVINWWPYQCAAGCCPECGGGTTRKQEPADADADVRFKAAMRARVERERSEHNHKLFADFCARRDAQAAALHRDPEQHGEAA